MVHILAICTANARIGNMKKLYAIIICLCAVILWRECLHQSRRAALKAYYEEQIQIAIEDTADELLEACERALDDACSL